MYSVVLMMAISGGAEAPDFGRGCNGCSGFNGCSGACHGGGHGCRGGLFGGHGCRGGCSGCSGFVSHGCAGACHGGCNGGGHGCRGGLFGGHGCRGGLFGGHRRGCNGCNGGCFGGCHGACTGGACTGGACHGCTGTDGGVIIEKKKEMPKGGEKTSADVPATIIVTLPETARLTIDGAATTSTSARRTFVTPALDVDSEYVYTLRAEVMIEGRLVDETQTVTVRGGQTTNVPFNFTSTGVASR